MQAQGNDLLRQLPPMVQLGIAWADRIDRAGRVGHATSNGRNGCSENRRCAWLAMATSSGSTEDASEGASRAVGRTLALLDFLSRADAPMGTREIARSLGLPLSATHRLLEALERHGFARRDPASRKFALSTRILELGMRLLDKLDVRQVALPVMREVRDRSEETVTLYMVEGTERVCVERLESQQAVRWVIRVGSRMPLHMGAPGKVLLAHLPPDQQHAVLRGTLHRFTEHTIVNPEELRLQLQEIRSQGYARSTGEHIPDSRTVAAPIWGYGDRGVVAALAISAPLMRFTSERQQLLISLVVEGAARISGMLGGRRNP